MYGVSTIMSNIKTSRGYSFRTLFKVGHSNGSGKEGNKDVVLKYYLQV
jgi:hypothetical protein